MKLKMDKECIIVQGIKPEEELWGAYQFPTPYRTDDGIVVSVHVSDDSIKHFRQDTKRWFKSRDNGETWNEVSGEIFAECGLLLPNGDKLFFPQVGSIDVSSYTMMSVGFRTPATNENEKAPEGTLPLPAGYCFDIGRNLISGYDADCLPPSLSKKVWKAFRIPSGQTEAIEEEVALEWPHLTRVVYKNDEDVIMRPIFPHGRARIGPDGAIWISTYTGDGHIDPQTGRYSPYYAAAILRSEDNGRSFKLHSHMSYPADGSEEYPYLSGGFSDNDFEFMADGSIVWFMRSAWFGRTGFEWAPMYMSRSVDGGKTWSNPKKFSFTGMFPSICTLKGGETLICYARPGVFVTACNDGTGETWCDPLEVMTPGDRSSLANVKPERISFHDWDGACNNPQLLALDDGSALLFYSDFYYPDESGVKRKTILCRRITVE